MPKWARRIFLHVLPKVLLMKRPHRGTSLAGTHNMSQISKVFLTNTDSEATNQIIKETETEKMNRESLKCISQKYKKNENSLLKNRYDFKSLQDYHYYLDKTDAIKAVRTMINHLEIEDDERRVLIKINYNYLT